MHQPPRLAGIPRNRRSAAAVRPAASRRPPRNPPSGADAGGASRQAKCEVVAPLAEERVYACFLGEDNTLQLCRVDGEGAPVVLNSADAIAVAEFVARHRQVLGA